MSEWKTAKKTLEAVKVSKEVKEAKGTKTKLDNLKEHREKEFKKEKKLNANIKEIKNASCGTFCQKTATNSSMGTSPMSR